MRSDRDILGSVGSQCPVGKVRERWPTGMLGGRELILRQVRRGGSGGGRWPSLNCKWKWRWRVRGRRLDWMFVAEAMGGAATQHCIPPLHGYIRTKSPLSVPATHFPYALPSHITLKSPTFTCPSISTYPQAITIPLRPHILNGAVNCLAPLLSLRQFPLGATVSS